MEKSKTNPRWLRVEKERSSLALNGQSGNSQLSRKKDKEYEKRWMNE